MNRHKLQVLLVASALGLGLVSALAQQPGLRPPMMGGGMVAPGEVGLIERMADRLKLTDDQRQKIRGLTESARPDMEAIRDQQRQNMESLRKTRPDNPAYQSRVAEVSRNAGELTARAISNGAQLYLQVWTVLTPEQRTQLESLAAEMRGRMEERMKQRRERRKDG